ncbi:phosphatase PAP2 family protein, partial [Escherichia coli]|nr:phosphatase PAP2 family protein [Escherichia coli]
MGEFMLNKIKSLFIVGVLLPTCVFAAKPYMNHGSFLPAEEAINSYTLLPPPPEYNSTQFLTDESGFLYGRSLINTDRWKLAKEDADLSDDGIGSQFSSVVGVMISKENTPKLYSLFLKLRKDNDNAADFAKKHYMRVRPFVMFNTQTCEPDDEPFLRKSGSYPSGHSTNGWSMALILSEMVPEKSEQILRKGFDYGQSRVICGAHWQSDVDAGRVLGASVLSKLKSNHEFNKSFNEAKKEIRDKL